MVFSNLFFLCLFLPLNLICYLLARSIRAKNVVMLVFSLFFYAWGEPVYILLLVGMTFSCWFFARWMDRCRTRGGAKAALVCALAVCLGLLGVFKYAGFAAGTLHALFGFPQTVPQIALPIGISFYTFQLISYLADVYRREVRAQQKFWLLLMYVSLFHQCIAGPIVRYQDVNREILSRSVTREEAASGVTRFSLGLAKKALLANTCGALADTLLLSDAALSNTAQLAQNAAALASRPVLALWVGMLAYTLQIYLDFSAYSDMAIGMGRMIGFHYKENFDYPYASRSVAEFWRRWHISLGSFFRDYVYIPLGGNRRGLARTIGNLFVVWFLTGLWHGASWNFVLWGLYFFVFLVLERLFLGRVLESLPAFLSRLYTLAVVYFGWVLFRFEQPAYFGAVFSGLFGGNGNPLTDFETATTVLNYVFFLAFAVLAASPLAKKLGQALQNGPAGLAALYNAAQVAVPPLCLLLSTAALVGNSYNPFLYFQF